MVAAVDGPAGPIPWPLLPPASSLSFAAQPPGLWYGTMARSAGKSCTSSRCLQVSASARCEFLRSWLLPKCAVFLPGDEIIPSKHHRRRSTLAVATGCCVGPSPCLKSWMSWASKLQYTAAKLENYVLGSATRQLLACFCSTSAMLSVMRLLH